jgi:hypothetical protein
VRPAEHRHGSRRLSGGSAEVGEKVRDGDHDAASEAEQVLWEVRNRGQAAATLNALRGQVTSGGVAHEESTLYPGRHCVEVHLVRDGQVIADDDHVVVIR